MQIIPVIDLLDGIVVRGVGGDRSNYQAIRSKLCDSPAPRDVAKSLLEFHPFKTIYLADLNALQCKGDSMAVIKDLVANFPNTEFWLDAGYKNSEEILACPSTEALTPILASECIRDLAHYASLRSAFAKRRFILSLDHKGGRLGAPALFRDIHLWPHQVIVMALDGVGKGGGPSLELIAGYQAHSPKTQFIAAGGVRNGQDLTDLKDQGCQSVLIASALHSGKITRQVLREF
jgi:phosphoribosylformimino-5-aminoimidazole carboxamide ribotide isomerase